jgi:hypothetical protein
MSTAEWNVLGLLLNLSGVLLLFRYGLPASAPTVQGKPRPPSSGTSWLGLVLFIAGTLCQLWANIRWVSYTNPPIV